MCRVIATTKNKPETTNIFVDIRALNVWFVNSLEISVVDYPNVISIVQKKFFEKRKRQVVNSKAFRLVNYRLFNFAEKFKVRT